MASTKLVLDENDLQTILNALKVAADQCEADAAGVCDPTTAAALRESAADYRALFESMADADALEVDW